MTSVPCRNLAKDCIDTLSAADSQDIQKVFLNHVHTKHPQQWRQLSRQFRAVSIVTIRDRFLKQAAEALKSTLSLS